VLIVSPQPASEASRPAVIAAILGQSEAEGAAGVTAPAREPRFRPVTWEARDV